MATVGTANTAHDVWGRQCNGWHLLEGDDLRVIEECMPPGTAVVRHRHARPRQFFCVPEGTATLELDGVDHRLAGESGLHVPPGAAHQMRNQSEAELRFLMVSSPRSHGDREVVDG